METRSDWNEFIGDSSGEYSEARFLSLAAKLVEEAGGTDDAARKIAKAMFRASLYVCREGDPLGYVDFLALEVLRPGVEEMDRVRDWAKRVVNDSAAQDCL